MSDYSDLVEFVMPPPGNTCTVSGAWINPGDTVYAASYDAVKTGGAVCAAVARPESVPTADPAAKADVGEAKASAKAAK